MAPGRGVDRRPVTRIAHARRVGQRWFEWNHMSMLSAKSKRWLKDHFGARVQFDLPMRQQTSLRIGGPADAYVAPQDIRDLEQLVTWARDAQLPYMVIGRGTNLLVRDGGIRGLVIALHQGLNTIETHTTHADRALVVAMAGAKLQTLCSYAIEHGFAGLNFAVGIPGSVGGAIQMNAGTSHGCMAEVLAWVDILPPQKALQRLSRSELDFTYRALRWNAAAASRKQPAPVIVAGGFDLPRGDRRALGREAAQHLAQRKAHQPIAKSSAGCMFKNPAGDRPAGWLIDQAGLKGVRIGGAAVSEMHANYIINAAQATAAEVEALIETIQTRVWEKFQTRLETEVQIVGEEKNTP